MDGRPGKTPADSSRRYLRARKFVPSEAFGQFKDTEDWRKENQLEKLYNTIDIGEYEQTRVLVGSSHRDKSVNLLTLRSTLNGLVDKTVAVFLYTFSKSPT